MMNLQDNISPKTYPFFSLIVPVYNKGKFLKDMFESVKTQLFQDWELICVNDGSTDDSLEVLQTIQKTDPRITVINKKNEGPASARNEGLLKSKGKYIWFIDADDKLTNNSLNILHEKLNDTNIDLLAFCADIYSVQLEKKRTTEILSNFGGNQNVPLEKRDIVLTFNKYNKFLYKINYVLWNKVIRREFIIKNNIKFDNRLFINDDHLFLLHIYDRKPKVKLISDILYTYREDYSTNVLGVMRSSSKKIFDLFIFFDEVLLMSRKSKSFIIKKHLYNHIINNIIHYYNEIDNNNKQIFADKSFEVLKRIQNEFKEIIKRDNTKFVYALTFIKNGLSDFVNIPDYQKNLYILKIKLFSKKWNKHYIDTQFLGIPFKKSINHDTYIQKYMFNLPYEKINLLNNSKLFFNKFEFFEKKSKQEKLFLNQIAANKCMNENTRSFFKYKNSFRGKSVFVLGYGPSSFYATSLLKNKQDNTIYIGGNRSFKIFDIQHDYIFMSDWNSVRDYISELEKDITSVKFFGKNILNYQKYIPDIAIQNIVNSNTFYQKKYSNNSIMPDIDVFPLTDFSAITLTILQFALYGEASKIYLIGCDSDNKGYMDTNTDFNFLPSNIVNYYKVIKKFAEKFHPKTEIISINPIALKGIFSDLYTKDFVEAHHELLIPEEQIL